MLFIVALLVEHNNAPQANPSISVQLFKAEAKMPIKIYSASAY
jgi:hypothetical protein